MDKFETFAPGLTAPASAAFEVTPDDVTDLTHATRGVNVGITGNVRLTTLSGSTVTLHMVAGSVFPVRATRIWATGTTALNIVGLY